MNSHCSSRPAAATDWFGKFQWPRLSIPPVSSSQIGPLVYRCRVDSCPVLPVADALLIAQHVDGVVFSVMQDVSQLPKVMTASLKLHQLNIPLVGAVVNGIKQEVYSYSDLRTAINDKTVKTATLHPAELKADIELKNGAKHTVGYTPTDDSLAGDLSAAGAKVRA